MSVIVPHAFTEQNTEQTTSSTGLVDVPGASIDSSNFVAGRKYLIHITAQITDTVGAGGADVIAVHGSTTFNESEFFFVPGTTGERATYSWFTVWTAVGGEGIKLQFAAGASSTVSIDQIAMLALELTGRDLLENVDWAFAERPNNDALSSAFLDGASLTFTPPKAGDWLVLSYAQFDINTNTASIISRINAAGDVTDVVPEARWEPVAVATGEQIQVSRVYALTAQSNTFKEQAATSVDATGDVRLHSAIFALNLSRFMAHGNAFTAADLALSATNYATLLQTISITPPDVASDVWIGASWGFDKNNASRVAKFRVQVDSADQPPGQTTDNYTFDFGADLSDEDPIALMTVENLSAAAHTVDLDASVDSTTGAPTGQYRTLWAVTLTIEGHRANMARF